VHELIPSNVLAPKQVFFVAALSRVLNSSRSASARAKSFTDFDWAQSKAQAKRLQHPRSFPTSEETSRVFTAASIGEWKPGCTTLDTNVQNTSTSTIVHIGGCELVHDEQKIAVEK